MNAAWYGLSVLAVCIVAYWCMTNDGRSSNEATTGILAMKKSLTPRKRKRRTRKPFSLDDVR